MPMIEEAITTRSPRDRDGWRGLLGAPSVLSTMLVSLIMLACNAGAAAAQTPGTCSNLERLGTTRLQVSQQFGRALVEIERLGGEGRRAEVNYGDQAYVGKLGADGKMRIGFVLVTAQNVFEVRLSEAPAVKCKVDVPEFKKIFRVVLRWHDAIQLNLHVVEPGGRLGGPGDVTPDGPAQSGTLGQIDVIGRVPDDGATAETSYIVPDASVLGPDRQLDFRVEYVTRGMKPMPPYCDEGNLASVQMELIIIDGGVATTTNVGTNRLRCGLAVPENRRFMRLER